MRVLFILLRLVGAAAIAAAIIGQYVHSLAFRAEHGVDENGVPAVNFFSFFTVDSNVLSVVVLLIGAVLLVRGRGEDPVAYTVARASVTAYMATTGIVYNTLLRGIEVSEGATLGWSNEILHVAGPLLLVVDWLFAPGRRALEWRHIGVVVAFPVVWAVYTMLRGPFVVDPTQAALNPRLRHRLVSVPVPQPRQLRPRLRLRRVLRRAHRRRHRRRRRGDHLGVATRTLAAAHGRGLRMRDRILAALGTVSVTAALVIIWVARLGVPRELYVSELGADGEPTAAWFERALLLIVAGGLLVAWAGRRIVSRAPVLRRWRPSVSIAISSALFLFASQVPCTSGCPVPRFGPDLSWQDLGHVTAAALAFAFAAWAMLQCAFAVGHRVIRRFSFVAALSVAIIAGAGGLMSLFDFYAWIGSRFEFVATTVGIAWLAIYGLAIAFERRPVEPPGSAPVGRVAPHGAQEVVG